MKLVENPGIIKGAWLGFIKLSRKAVLRLCRHRLADILDVLLLFCPSQFSLLFMLSLSLAFYLSLNLTSLNPSLLLSCQSQFQSFIVSCALYSRSRSSYVWCINVDLALARQNLEWIWKCSCLNDGVFCL